MAAPGQAEQLATLLDLQRELALETDVDVVLRRIAETATTLLDAERSTLFVVDAERGELWSRVLTESEVSEIRLPLDGRSLAAEIAREGATLRVDRPYDDPRFDPSVDARTGYRTRSVLVLPIEARDRRRLGVLEVVNRRTGGFTAEDERLGLALAGAASIALEYLRLNEDLAAERLRVVRVAEETRHRLARELHDGVAQALANAAMGIEIAQRRGRSDPAGALAELGATRERLVASQRELRDILFALRPVALESGGLAAAVQALAERTDGTSGTRVRARRVETAQRLRAEVEAGAFAVVREAVNNAIKTGRAGQVNIDLVDGTGTLAALVEDDGSGFDVEATLAAYSTRGSLGLLQMRESARLIGARLEIDSSPGQGTRVRLTVPTEGRSAG
jgi:signal transduction histidine kinase